MPLKKFRFGVQTKTKMELNIIKKPASGQALVILAEKAKDLKNSGLSSEEIKWIDKNETENYFEFSDLGKIKAVVLTPKNKKVSALAEAMRVSGAKVSGFLNKNKVKESCIIAEGLKSEFVLAFLEGLALAGYQFLKYKTDAEKEQNSLSKISIIGDIKEKELRNLEVLIHSVFKARDLVNEPQSYLNAIQFAKELEILGKDSGCKVEVFNKSKIESMKMGGLLAVNRGSQIPPTFTVMEYKPAKAVNKKPLVLVGKGVVYDTGGLSLKPTPNSMDYMKCDMAGGAVVACAISAIAKMQLPVHVIALIPATDNRPGEDAYTPGDVIKMYGGQSVEVLNTDAEGRMILADALSYSNKFKPELVMNFATLTGAAAAAIGHYGIVCMGNAEEEVKLEMKKAGEKVNERLAEFPFWDEYSELIKSDVADMKNIGGPIAGAITAGKFLEKFVESPFMHFDIAGSSFLSKTDAYRTKNGSGYGVRFLVEFIKNYSQNGK